MGWGGLIWGMMGCRRAGIGGADSTGGGAPVGEREMMAGGGSGPTRIVVLGAGYAGLTCFLELQDRAPRTTDLVLVNADAYHWFTTELHTYVAGQEEESVRVPLRRVVHRPGRLLIRRVERVDSANQRVLFTGGESLRYDFLVFALGSDPEYYGLPGVQENSLVVGNYQGARALRERISALARNEQPPHIVVAGGGLTGVEVVGELADEYGGRLRLSLVEAGPQIMAGFDPSLVAAARSVLESKGIQVLAGNPIKRVEGTTILFRSGERLHADLLIWAGGVRGSSVLARSGFVTTPKGRGMVDPFLRAEGIGNVYLVGDSAAFLDGSRELPPTAQAAVQMGKAVARNLLNRMRGMPEELFVPRLRGAFASLGREEGVGQLGADLYQGAPAMVIKHLIEAHHAYETGAGVLPLVRRILQAPFRLWVGRRAARTARQPAPPPTQPEPVRPEETHGVQPAALVDQPHTNEGPGLAPRSG